MRPSPPLTGMKLTPICWVRNGGITHIGFRCLTCCLSCCCCCFSAAGTSSIDTTCTIWGLETGQVLGRVNLVSGHVKTQLIAHDKEVCLCVCNDTVCGSERSLRGFIQLTALTSLSRCMTLHSAVQEEVETCSPLWALTARSVCSTSGTWNTAPSSMKTPSTTRCSASAGTSRTLITWPRWPWTAWRSDTDHLLPSEWKLNQQ